MHYGVGSVFSLVVAEVPLDELTFDVEEDEGPVNTRVEGVDGHRDGAWAMAVVGGSSRDMIHQREPTRRAKPECTARARSEHQRGPSRSSGLKH